MIYEYKTIFTDTSGRFNEKLNEYGKLGFKLDKFVYKEYTQRVEGKAEIIQAYVGVMMREII